MPAPVLSKVGVLSTGTGGIGTTIVVTGVGFTPKIVLFRINRRTETSDALGAFTSLDGFGAATSPTNRFVVVRRSTNGAAAAVTGGYHSAAAVIASFDAAEAVDGLVDFQSMDADGFTLVIDDAMPGGGCRVLWWALGGADLQAITGSFTPAGVAPVTQTVTGLGFTPTAVVFAAISPAAGAAPAGVIDSIMMLGAMSGASNEGIWAGGSNDAAVTMQTMSYCRSGECIARFVAAVTSTQDRAEFSAFASDQFTINWLERTSAGTIFYVALGGVDAVVGTLLTQTDTTTPVVVSGLGFSPSSLMLVSANAAEDAADTPHDHDKLSLGFAAAAANQSMYASIDRDNTANAEVAVGLSHDSIYGNIAADLTTYDGEMAVQSFDGAGFTSLMTDADPTQMFAWFLALGPRTPEAKAILIRQAVNRSSRY